MTRLELLNGSFDRLTLPETVDRMFAMVERHEPGWVCTVNVSVLMMMRSDPSLQTFVDAAAVTVADGQPLVWCSGRFGSKLPERVTGIDLIEAAAARAGATGRRLFLLGASTDVVERVADSLRARHPRLEVGCADGYFGSHEAPEVADRIRAFGTDVLFVGMGVPRQERFIAEQWGRLGPAVAVGVGGSFDVLGGLRRRAPRWVQTIGMEWAFRLAQEPRRLFKRYLTTNTQFLWCLARAGRRSTTGTTGTAETTDRR